MFLKFVLRSLRYHEIQFQRFLLNSDQSEDFSENLVTCSLLFWHSRNNQQPMEFSSSDTFQFSFVLKIHIGFLYDKPYWYTGTIPYPPYAIVARMSWVSLQIQQSENKIHTYNFTAKNLFVYKIRTVRMMNNS